MLVELPEYFDSKSADVILIQEGEAGTAWWFELDGGKVLTIDYLSFNIPQLEVHFFDSIEDALKRKTEMVEKEGWEIERDDLEER